jgi:hypothetical protein
MLARARTGLYEESNCDADLFLVRLPSFGFRQLSAVEDLDLITRRGMFGITEVQQAEAKGVPICAHDDADEGSVPIPEEVGQHGGARIDALVAKLGQAFRRVRWSGTRPAESHPT